MTTPADRVPVRIARGTASELTAVEASLKEGEICFATDEDRAHIKTGGSLTAIGQINQIGSDFAVVGGEALDNLVTITQANYDSLTTPDANTFYIVDIPAAPGPGSNDNLIAYLDQYTGTATTQAISTDDELVGLFVFRPEGTQNFNGIVATYWNVANGIPNGYGWPADNEQYYTGLDPTDGSAITINTGDFTLGTNVRINANAQTYYAWGIRKDGETLRTSASGPTSTTYLTPGSGVQVITWVGDGNTGNTIKHGCGVEPGMIFWCAMDSTEAAPGKWRYTGQLFASSTTTSGEIRQQGWYTDTWSGSSLATLQSSFTSTDWVQPSYADPIFGTSGTTAYLALAFYDVTDVCKVGLLDGPGSGTLSINLGFRPQVIITKGLESDSAHMMFLDSPASQNTSWAGLDETGPSNIGTASGFTITATGFDVSAGVPGNDGTNEAWYIALANPPATP